MTGRWLSVVSHCAVPLRAQGTAGGSRAFGALVDAGMDPADAARETGLTLTRPVTTKQTTEPDNAPIGQ